MELHRISEDEDLTDEERQNARNLLFSARDYRNNIQKILGYNPGGENDETVSRDPVSAGEASALRQAYVEIVGKETDMLKVVADQEQKAADAVWRALNEPQIQDLTDLDDTDNTFATGYYKQSGAMTFAQIADGPLKTVFIGPREYKAVSVKNRKPSDGGADAWTKNTHDQMRSGARATYPFTYQGIEGSVVCRGECVTTETDPIEKPDDRFDDGWYFVPVKFTKGGTAVEQENENKSGSYFVMKGEDKYEEALLVRYGMWLDGSVLHREVGVDYKNGRDNGNPVIDDSRPGLDPTAIYQGHAGGLAARKHGTDNMDSGQFEASVRLRATFGGNPRLDGLVYDFRPADPVLDREAVDTDWFIDLFPTDLMDDATATGNNWTATGFGKDSDRPEGFYGDFHHEFDDEDEYDDGRVAGVYVAQDN